MIWLEKHNVLFHEWCESETSDNRRFQIYNKIHGALFQMAKATLRKKFKGLYEYSEENELINECVNDILTYSISKFNGEIRYNSFYWLNTSISNWWLSKLLVKPNQYANKMFINPVREDEHFIKKYGYDNLFIQKEDEDSRINDVLDYFEKLIDNLNLEIFDRLDSGLNNNKTKYTKLEYLNLVYEYIKEYGNYNIYNFNEYVFNNSNLKLNTIINFSRTLFGIEGDFNSHSITRDEIINR